jgi:hypothetical protein
LPRVNDIGKRIKLQLFSKPCLSAARARVFFSLVLGAVFFSAPVRAEGEMFDWKWNSLDQECGGDCFAAIYGGPFIESNMSSILGLDGYTPPWKVDPGAGGIIAGTLGRRVATLWGVIDVEPEIGIAKRLGNMDQVEIWAAIFFRWTKFPWNDVIYTTVAASTGLNYAIGVSEIERERANNGLKGSKLLHFFSPEITFAMPEHKDLEVLFRFHHRSGGKEIFCGSEVFNCASGGAHYATVGVRYRF